jgi:hypothetical protein
MQTKKLEMISVTNAVKSRRRMKRVIRTAASRR